MLEQEHCHACRHGVVGLDVEGKESILTGRNPALYGETSMLGGKSRESDMSIEDDMGEACRKHLPADLERRLLAVWAKLGHLIEWCRGRGCLD